MKKRLIGILSMVLVIALLSVSAVSCTFIKENEFRTANETYATVNHAGVTLTISYNEFMDYCNNNNRLYTYVNSYGMEVGEALDLCIKGKIQTKYLTAEAMAYLVDGSKVSAARIAALYGKGSKATPVDVLTYAERYQAIYAVNESIREAIESNIDDAKQDAYTSAYNKISLKNVKEIVFAEGTKNYLESFTAGGVVVGAELDTDKIKIKVVYDDGTESEEFVVPSTLYTTAFSSEAESSYSSKEATKTMVITVAEEITDSSGEESTEDHTLEYEYTLVYPRTTKSEATEETDYTKVTIDEEKIDRYASDAAIPAEVKAKCQIIDINAEYEAVKAKGSDKYEIEAYRVLIENIKSGNHDMAYFYNAQYESQVLSAIGAELYIKSDKAFDSQSEETVNAKIVSDFKYLSDNAKKAYDGKTADEVRSAFVSAIGSTGSGLDTLYYYPGVDNIEKYSYVKQILFKFDEETTAFLSSIRNDKDALAKASAYFRENAMVTPSNPNYDADYECPEHKLKEDGASCSYEGEGLCPSIPYGEDEKLSEVIAKIKNEFDGIMAGEGTEEEKYAKIAEAFDKYIYIYNDDSGTFNNNWGYLIAPETKDNSWVTEFTELGQSLIDYNNTVGNVYTESGKLAECYTMSLSGSDSDYAGVSIMMVSATPFEGVTSELSFADDAAIISYFKNYTKGDGTSLYDTFKKNLRDEARSSAYSDFTKCVPTEIFERNDKNKITVNKSVKDEIKIEKSKLKKNIYDVYVG